MTIGSFVHVAILLLGALHLSAQVTVPQAHFKSGSKSFPENIGSFVSDPDIDAQEWTDNYTYRYIQFTELPTVEKQDQLKSAGWLLIDYIPDNTYLVGIPRNFDPQLAQSAGARSVTRPFIEDKMDHRFIYGPIPDWALIQGRYRVTIKAYPKVDEATFYAKLTDLGMGLNKENFQFPFFFAHMTEEEVESYAALPFVQYVQLGPAPAVPEDLNGRALQRANLINNQMPGGLRLDGGGVGPHIDFQGRIVDFTNNASGGTHGDGVAGVMAGNGNLNPDNAGIASGAEIYVLNYNATFTDNTVDLHQNDNVVITNSSYSDGCNAGYTTTTQRVDQQMIDNPNLMHVFSAGNSNGNNCNYGAGNQWGNITGGHKQGKNVLAVANLFADGNLVGSSSRGPAHDGRIKPDISAHGQNQISTNPNNNYQTFGGTSAAAPTMAGSLAQLYQAYRQLNGGSDPDASLMKALVLNTAYDMGNPGPDFKYGWGRIDAYQAHKALDNDYFLTASIGHGGSNTHTITIPSGATEMRAMIYWRDPAAAVNSTTALVNDLDMTVEDPAASLHLPWLLDPTPDPVILDTPAGKGADHINNVEQVTIDQPSAGTYTVTVDGTTVPMGNQEYVLVWCFLYDQVVVTYPYGGESLEPGETVYIHWDAMGTEDPFTIEYSTDDGVNWNTIASSIPGDARLWNWSIPSTTTSKGRVRVVQGMRSDQSDGPFSILGPPTDISITDFCLGEVTVSWTALAGVDEYIVYQLGANSMEEIDRTSLLETRAIDLEAGEEVWFAVQGIGADGLIGRRSDAVPHTPDPGAVNCRNTIAFEKLANVAGLNAGDTVMYTLKVFSYYDDPITNVTVTDPLDPTWKVIAGSLTCGTITDDVMTIGPATINPDDSLVCSFKVRSNLLSFTEVDFMDDLENGTANWTPKNDLGTTEWSLSTAQSNSPSNAWFSPNAGADNFQSLILAPIFLQERAEMSFYHFFDTESDWDGGYIEISTDEGLTWDHLNEEIKVNGYNSVLGASSNPNIGGKSAWSGSSGGFIKSVIDLSSFAFEQVQIRFVFGEDNNTFSTGWYIDDIAFARPFYKINTACVDYDQGASECAATTMEVQPCLQNCDSCVDGVRNGDEVDMDCGGSLCVLCPCTSAQQDVVLSNVTFTDGTNERVERSLQLAGGVTTEAQSVVELRAGQEISINSDFTAGVESDLLLQIDQCEFESSSSVPSPSKK